MLFLFFMGSLSGGMGFVLAMQNDSDVFSCCGLVGVFSLYIGEGVVATIISGTIVENQNQICDIKLCKSFQSCEVILLLCVFQ